MIPIAQVKAGLETYIQQEILSKTSGLPRWGVGALLGIVFKKSDTLVESIRANKLVKALGLIDESGGVDVETIFGELKK
jgi:hypothetical protein